MFSVPILLIIFNRPETTARVFAELKKLRPARLFIVADGPRTGKPDDYQKCQKTREIIENGIDWDCIVSKNYFDVNKGCGKAPSQGITWFFGTVEEGIILEDDCLPDQSFFPYCSELLEKYRNDERIAVISGDNFQDNQTRGDGSYYFSNYTHTWGWASWRRVWKEYDFDIDSFPLFKKQGIIKRVWPNNKLAQTYWLQRFAEVYKNKSRDCWDLQLNYLVWEQGGLACLPNSNLISNIGFSNDATHTFSKNRIDSSIPLQAMKFPLVTPSMVVADHVADDYTNRKIFKITILRVIAVFFLKKIKVYDWLRSTYVRLVSN